MTNEKDNLRAVRILNKSNISMLNALRFNMQENGINPTEFMVLEYLKSKKTSSVQDVANTINITSGSMTYVVNALITKKLITKNQCVKDKRKYYLSLTAYGEEIIYKAFLEHVKFINDLMSVLTNEEIKVMTELNKKLGLWSEEIINKR